MMAHLKCIDELVAEFARRKPVRAGSLIISVFGDSISQHGNAVWLGSLIRALEPFGMNSRQIRTAVFRLVRENWLVAKQIGRRSFYSLTDFGLRHYEKAARRIYAGEKTSWDGRWTLVIPAFVPASKRDLLRKELLWLGYGAISPGLFAHPAADRRSLDETIQELDVTRETVVFTAHTDELSSKSALQTLSHDCWNLAAIEQRYDEFLNRFRPVYNKVQRAKSLQPDQCFQLRTLLIHEYRRILLHDTDLPAELLAANWPGNSAGKLTANIYRAVHRQAIDYLTTVMESIAGGFPQAVPGYFSRFGGLP